jgi:hypothetical protein
VRGGWVRALSAVKSTTRWTRSLVALGAGLRVVSAFGAISCAAFPHRCLGLVGSLWESRSLGWVVRRQVHHTVRPLLARWELGGCQGAGGMWPSCCVGSGGGSALVRHRAHTGPSWCARDAVVLTSDPPRHAHTHEFAFPRSALAVLFFVGLGHAPSIHGVEWPSCALALSWGSASRRSRPSRVVLWGPGVCGRDGLLVDFGTLGIEAVRQHWPPRRTSAPSASWRSGLLGSWRSVRTAWGFA